MPLGTKAIDKLLRDGKAGKFPYTHVHDEHGMYHSRDLNSWLQHITIGGRRRWMGLGPRSSVSLADARELGRKARSLAAAGTDPIVKRQADRNAAVVLSVDAAMAHYFKTHKAEWRNRKTAVRFEQLSRDYIAPVIGKQGVGTLTYADVLRVLQPHWASKTISMVRLRSWLHLSLVPARKVLITRNFAAFCFLTRDHAPPPLLTTPGR